MNIKDKLQQHLVMSMFATRDDLYEEMNKQREDALTRILELEARLEIDPRTKYDGIDCRDICIEEQENLIESLHSKINLLQSQLIDEPRQEQIETQSDEIVTALYRRFKEWSKRGFSADDVTWCEVKADVIALVNLHAP